MSARLRAHGITTHSLGGRGPFGDVRGLARLLRRGGWDVVNAYGFKATLVARLLTRIATPRARFVCGVRGLHVTEVRDIDSPKARLAAAVERGLSWLVDVYDANSPGAVAFLADLGIDRARLRYIPNGLDLDRWSVRSSANGGPPMVLCVARFVPRKRHELLVEALAILSRSGVPFRAVLAGDGPRREAIEAMAAEAGLADRVGFPGAVEPPEVQSLLEQARVFCLPSAWEGMPGAIMEAMACGVSVVATDVNGADALVVDGVTGRLVASDDPQALADALRETLLDEERARRYGAAGRTRMESDFSLDAMVSAKEELYTSIAGGR
jgi:glycosyltransferase involved in cell wall biosynthesis